jgi:transcriptional regulator with XRE-family HTH domain
MLASEPSPEVGQRLKVARLRARLSTRDVERLSHIIASERNNPDCCVTHSWLVQVESGEFVPGIVKLYTLCRLYKLNADDMLALFGFGLPNAGQGYMSLKLPNTHLLGPVQETKQALLAPLGPAAAERLSRTNLMSRIFDNWEDIPVLLRQIDLQNSILGYIGLKDNMMYPLLRPGSVVQVDARQKAIKSAGWRNEYERPIYFVEMRDSCVCSWCDLDGSNLFLIPGPVSGQTLRRVRYPVEAEIVGRVTGVVMSLVDRQRE